MRLRNTNTWDLSPAEAVSTQRRLVGMVKGGTIPKVKIVLGVDVSYRRKEQSFRACAVWLRLPHLTPAGSSFRVGEISFPYIPGLLSFREIPPLVPILERAPRPDLIIVDGHGIAHPRGFGLACHLGIITGVPTIGCAKNLLVGTCRSPGQARGDKTPLTYDGKIVGYALRSREGCKPLYISPGHLLDPEEAVKGVLMCLKGYRLPEPTRIADKLSKQTKDLSTKRLSD